MTSALQKRLVANARDWWKWSSVHFALLGGAVTSWATTDPKSFAAAVALLPEGVRPLVGVALAAIAIGLRVTTKKGA